MIVYILYVIKFIVTGTLLVLWREFVRIYILLRGENTFGNRPNPIGLSTLLFYN